ILEKKKKQDYSHVQMCPVGDDQGSSRPGLTRMSALNLVVSLGHWLPSDVGVAITRA
ncbi:hypothetical protein Bpfe_004705, partial [Biomphalaria pfeifferi]